MLPAQQRLHVVRLNCHVMMIGSNTICVCVVGLDLGCYVKVDALPYIAYRAVLTHGRLISHTLRLLWT